MPSLWWLTPWSFAIQQFNKRGEFYSNWQEEMDKNYKLQCEDQDNRIELVNQTAIVASLRDKISKYYTENLRLTIELSTIQTRLNNAIKEREAAEAINDRNARKTFKASLQLLHYNKILKTAKKNIKKSKTK